MSGTDGGLRRIFRQALPTAQWTTIETGATAQGVPDAEFIFPRPVHLLNTALRESQVRESANDGLAGGASGVQGWIEYKQTSGWSVTLNPGQIGWLSRRVRLGGRAFVAVRRITAGGPKSKKADELWLYALRSPDDPKILREFGLIGGGIIAQYKGDGGPGEWDWAKVGAVLKGESNV